MVRIDPRFIKEFYGKDLIAYGTGDIARLVIPYLVREPGIFLHGVTDSSMTREDEGEFCNTGLRMRSLETWAKLMPDAAVLIVTIKKEFQEEIARRCEAAGFRDILRIPASEELPKAIADAQMEKFTTPRGDFYDQCLRWATRANFTALELMCYANQIRDVHKASFSEFRGCNRGRSIVLVCTGPSMRFYEPMENTMHIGVNTAIKRKDIRFDYYFTQDYQFLQQYDSEADFREDLKACGAVKFFGQYSCEADREAMQFPEDIIEDCGGRRYFLSSDAPELNPDIEHFPLMVYHSIAFPAIQFAMYTRASRILLVGCDSKAGGHYDGALFSTPDCWDNTLLEGYRKIKRLAERFYRDTEIISVNPVGLRGMFRDVYTESYLREHPELDRSNCKILE